MPSQRSPSIPRTKAELERLVAWMEDNQLILRGKQIVCYRKIKKQGFSDINDEMNISQLKRSRNMGDKTKHYKKFGGSVYP